MRKISLFLLLSIFLVLSTNAFAQKKYAPTFLWKITGNGLKKPSYMYGTMHLQDKELFNLADSIYFALESVDGFSMEVDPNALMTAILKSLNDKDESPLLKDVIEEKKLKKLEKNIESKYGVSADKLTVKTLKKYIRNKVYEKKEGQMKTFMDMYLYNIAKNQNKKFAPVEDVEDQLSLMDNYSAKSMETILEIDSISEEMYMQDFKKIYIKKDLTALAKMIENDKTETYSSLGLLKRNIKMARRIDSLTKIRTSFIAIGAAHLPGDSGLIKLLQNKGFTIEPVLSNKNIKPEEYKYKIIEKEWVNSVDVNDMISVQIPLEPTYKPYSKGMSMKMSIDLSDYSLYGFGAFGSGETVIDITKMTERMMAYYKSTGFEILSNKQITQNGLKGIEFIGRENNEYIFRSKVLFKDKVIAILICGAQNKKYLYDQNFERFFNSIKFNENVKPKEWVEFVNEENSYSIQLPIKPTKTDAIENEEASSIFTYTATDAVEGSSYLCQTVVPKIGYYFPNDSTYYNNYKTALPENTKAGLQYFSPAVLNDIPAMHFAVALQQDDLDLVMQGYIFRKENNFQILIAVTAKETADYPNVSSFFNSYKSLPSLKTNWTTKTINDIGISVLAPADFTFRKKDSSSTDNGKNYYTEDKNTGTTYYVDMDTASNYAWYKNDSTYYRDVCNPYKEFSDSVVSFKYDTIKYTADVLFKMENSSLYKKLHFVVNGNKIYSMFSYFPETIMNGDAEQRFFKEYKITSVIKPTIFENKIKLLTDSLVSKDSTSSANAFAALYNTKFVKTDLPFLHNALLKKYPTTNADKNEEFYRTRSISSKIITVADSSTLNFIQNEYLKETTTDDVKVCMLEILADVKTEHSFDLLKTMLLKSKLQSIKSHSFSYNITDSLLLAKILFPEVTALYNDTILGGAMMQIANKLLDSSFIKEDIALLNAQGILDNAAHQIMVFKRDKTGSSPYSYDIIKMLGRLKNKKANDLLQNFLANGDKWDKAPALVQLLKNDVPVAPATILKIATDKEERTTLYDNLKEIGKEKYFPKTLLTQQKFAEGYLYELLTAEYEQENPLLTFITEKVSKVGGVEKRFFLYKVKNAYDGETYYNLAIMGGFDKNIQKVSLKYDDQLFYYEEEKFTAGSITKLYDTFIKNQNENIKKN